MYQYLSKKISKLPFTVNLALSAIVWAILSAVLGLFLILSQANFEATGTKKMFIFSIFLCVISAGLLAIVEYGALRIFGIKIERKKLRVLNDNIKEGRLLPNLPSKTLKTIFYSLIREVRISVVEVGSRYIGLVILFLLLIEWMASGKTTNIPIIFLGGLISWLLYVLFTTFFAEYSIFIPLKECRALLRKRNEKIEEPRLGLIGLRKRFSIFLLIPIFIVLVILSLISPLNLNIITLVFVGLVMAVIIGRILASSIYQAFSGIKDFARELPMSEKALFSTGSLDPEIIDLSKSLNKTADEVYMIRRELEEAKTILEVKVEARTKALEEERASLEDRVKEKTKELQKSKEELQKRVDELERFQSLTIGRELKMTTLKKEIEKLKKELEKDNRFQ